MNDSGINFVVTLSHAQDEGSHPCHLIDRIPSIEIIVHKDLTDHGTRKDRQMIVLKVNVEDLTAFGLAPFQESVLVLMVFLIMGRVSRTEGSNRDRLVSAEALADRLHRQVGGRSKTDTVAGCALRFRSLNIKK